VGTRELVIPALERGLVEVVPEYAGSASSFLGGSPTADRSETHDELSELLHERGIEALDAAPAQNHNALVVSAETADALSLRSISDLIPYASDMTLGGPPECPSRELCLLGLETVYDLAFNSFLPLGGGGTFTGEAITRGSVDVGIMFTTDGVLAGHELVVLDDDRGLQPAENLTPLVRDDTLQRFGPQVADVLDLVSAQLTTEALRSLNGEVERGSDIATVAEAWLSDHEPALRSASEAPTEAQ
jgi:osmoprotectant transport system substrate-binding protein